MLTPLRPPLGQIQELLPKSEECNKLNHHLGFVYLALPKRCVIK